MKINARFLVRLYPRAWQERYGDEMLAMLGDRVDWRTAMDLMDSTLREHLAPSSSVNYVGIARGLAAVGGSLMMFLGVLGILDATVLTRSGLAFPAAITEASNTIASIWRPIAIAWFVLALLVILVAILVNALGWRRAQPRAAAASTRLSAFLILVVLQVATVPPLASISPGALKMIAAFDLSALLIGFVVCRSLFRTVVQVHRVSPPAA